MADQAITLRAMRPEDLPVVSDLWVEAWAAAYPGLDFEARRPWFAAHLAALAEGGAQRILALIAGEIAGLVTIEPHSGYLDQLVVARRFHGRGVAQALLLQARRVSPESVTLDVNQDNARAVHFYAKHGFAVVGADVNARGAPTYRMCWIAGGPAAASGA